MFLPLRSASHALRGRAEAMNEMDNIEIYQRSFESAHAGLTGLAAMCVSADQAMRWSDVAVHGETAERAEELALTQLAANTVTGQYGADCTLFATVGGAVYRTCNGLIFGWSRVVHGWTFFVQRPAHSSGCMRSDERQSALHESALAHGWERNESVRLRPDVHAAYNNMRGER